MVDGRETERAYLACCIDDVTVVLDPLVVDALCESGLDGGVVGLDEVVLDELNDEGRFACERGREGRTVSRM